VRVNVDMSKDETVHLLQLCVNEVSLIRVTVLTVGAVKYEIYCRGRPKVEIPTESRPKVTYHIRPKPYVPPKVNRDFRPKTETESQSYLSRHDYGSQQVPPSVRCPTIPCICIHSHLAPSCQPCGVSLMTQPQGPTVPDADADNASASSV